MTSKTSDLALPALLSVATILFAAPVSAALYSLQANYVVPGAAGGTASVTAIYDNSGFTGTGHETFTFIEATLAFSAGDSLLHDTSHTVTDMFGVVFVDGDPVDLINHNNTELNGKSKLIFNSTEAPDYPGSIGIYMSDFGSSMNLEGWWVSSHQAAQAHPLVSIAASAIVPLPATAPLLGGTFGLMGLLGCRTRRGLERGP